ncbi:hypothetical protein KUTeg_022278 [Tegillarca granosa]|uniref:protein-tyrosine-phosphatase n=1 Tax=Tegillarca granosa TaxID=220873 RepID=A0ABQ9E5Y3_TEGGR|nr:hypothetical protein KUTeg_022278 [Tegillarca granosa]
MYTAMDLSYIWIISVTLCLFYNPVTEAQTCSTLCTSNQYCGYPQTGDRIATCLGCNIACQGCTGPNPDQCKLCAPGFYNVGGICRGCLFGKWGQNCTGDCHCLGTGNDDDGCDRTDGACVSNQCSWGWQHPPYCQDPCDGETFGKDCKFECHCPVNDTCNPINGLCGSGRCHEGLPRLRSPPVVAAYCGRANITFKNWVLNVDIGKGPISQYQIKYRIDNDTRGWLHLDTIPYSSHAATYVRIHPNLNQSLMYQYRVDVRRQDGDKVMQEFVPGFESDFYSVDCIITTTTSAPPVTPGRPPPGSIFSPDASAVYIPENTVKISWSTKRNYTAIVGTVWLSYGIIGIGDCEDFNKQDVNYTKVMVSKFGSHVIDVEPWRKYEVLIEADTIYHNVSESDRKIWLIFGPETSPELQTAPSGEVQNIQVNSKTARSITLSWSLPLCEQRGGFLKQYDIQVRDLTNSSRFQASLSTNESTITINNLIPYNRYGARVRFVNVIGAGTYSDEKEIITDEAEPSAPVITDSSAGISTITLSYTKPDPANGVIQEYQIAYSVHADFRDITNKPANTTSYVITDLKPFTRYFVKVRAKTNAPNWGNYSLMTVLRTNEDYPTPPYNITIVYRNETCLGLDWVFPSPQSGQIVEYSIHFMDMSLDTAEKQVKIIQEPSTGPYSICQLNSGKRYLVEVSAKTARGYGRPLTVYRTTEQADPPSPPPPQYINHTDTTITVAIDSIIINTGPLTSYSLFVNDVTADRKRKRQTSVPGYRTAVFPASSITKRTIFTIGTGILSNGIVNIALKPKHNYEIYLQITSTLEGISKSSFSKMDGTVFTSMIATTTTTQAATTLPQKVIIQENNYTPIIIAVVVIVLLIIIAIIILCIFLWYRRRRSQQYEPFEIEKEQIDMTKILHDDYDPHKYWNTIYSHRESRYIVAGRELLPDDSLNANGSVGFRDASPPVTFQQEFHDLPHAQLSPWNAALQRYNKNKNRFPHLLPYDHTRVILDRDDNSASDYINANYVHGYRKSTAYIAAQSPFDDESVLDFWRMLYQLDIKVVVMITNIIEDDIVKCTQYWPDPEQGRVTYGRFKLELIDQQEFADYIIRTVKIKTRNHADTKVVHIFDFCSWPDHGVPDDPIPLLEMRYKVREYHSGNKSPIVVHCGTGVSRTGTFIAIDALLEQYQLEGRISVFAFVRKLRKDRVALVRTVKQYIFIYEAIFEARVAGDTRTGLDLKQKYHTLTMKNPKTKHSFLRDQFICLQRYTRPLLPYQCSNALVPLNVDKNRFPDVVPPDNFRPHLLTPGPGDFSQSDYVNAVFLDGHLYRNHFIVTQTPLHTTVLDFWKLVYDYNISTIVMMESYKHEDDTCAEYWPEKKIKKFEPFFVDNTEIYQEENVTVRHFKLSYMHRPSEPSREIRQFQFNAWDDSDFIPKSKTMFLDLFDLVDDWQRVSKNHDKPILVHCKDGATHSGLFCASYVVCETMRKDGDVDVFHTIKHMKRRRTQIIDTLDQYRYCYKVLWDFMNLRQEGGTLTDMMNHSSTNKFYHNVGSLSLPSYTSHLEYM